MLASGQNAPVTHPSRRTIVSFHAHPDDEALLTAGTLAKAAAQGHRVVLVTATAGEVGLASSAFGTADTLAGHRLEELRRSAEAIGPNGSNCSGTPTRGCTGRWSRPVPPSRSPGPTWARQPRDWPPSSNRSRRTC